MNNTITDDELEGWANNRADDAGRLARELTEYRRADKQKTPGHYTAFIGHFVARCLERGFGVFVEFHYTVTGRNDIDCLMFTIHSGYMEQRILVRKEEIDLALFPAAMAVDKANAVTFPEKETA